MRTLAISIYRESLAMARRTSTHKRFIATLAEILSNGFTVFKPLEISIFDAEKTMRHCLRCHV